MKLQIITIVLFLITSSVIAQNDSIIKNGEEKIESFHTVIEQMPEFVGGYVALQRHISTYAICTENANKEKVTGRVFVSFFIDIDGSISEPSILRGLHPDLDSISLSIVKNMPNWTPATQRGKSIKCRFNLPIEFDCIQSQSSDILQPSKYWKKKGKKQFMKICSQEFQKSENECDCWYNFIIWNYNNNTLKELDIREMFNKQECK